MLMTARFRGVINKLWGVDTNYKSVSKFHVFHDSTNFYGSTGNARGQAVVNISNAAFPILMARNDKKLLAGVWRKTRLG